MLDQGLKFIPPTCLPMKAHSQPTISALIITLNEERYIRACLSSVAWVDEIIVVDAESTDRTIAIAKEFTTHIFTRPWNGFPAQRNYGLSQARGDWVLIIDADERITPAGKDEMTTWLNSSEVCDYSAALVPRKNFFFGKWIRFGGSYPDPQYRLFKKGKVRYDEQSLDTPKIEGKVKRFNQPLDHLTGERVADRTRKIERETTHKAKFMLTKRERVTPLDLIFRPFVNFVKCYILKQGFRDGIEGLICSGLSGSHTFLRYAKRAEMDEQKGKHLTLAMRESESPTTLNRKIS